MNERIVIYRSKKKAVYIILAGFLLLASSYLSFSYAKDDVFGWMFIIAAAFIFILGMSGVRDKKPYIVISVTGITDLYHLRQEIEWGAIVRAEDFYFRGQDFIALVLPDNYKPGLLNPTWLRRLNHIYKEQGLKVIYIRVSGLQISSGQLTHIITDMVNSDPAHRAAYLRSVKWKS